MTFAKWLKEVDQEISKIAEGFGLDDLPDYDYSGAFNDEEDPREVAAMVVAENNYPH